LSASCGWESESGWKNRQQRVKILISNHVSIKV
jgi:hypothetical protein